VFLEALVRRGREVCKIYGDPVAKLKTRLFMPDRRASATHAAPQQRRDVQQAGCKIKNPTLYAGPQSDARCTAAKAGYATNRRVKIKNPTLYAEPQSDARCTAAKAGCTTSRLQNQKPDSLCRTAERSISYARCAAAKTGYATGRVVKIKNPILYAGPQSCARCTAAKAGYATNRRGKIKNPTLYAGPQSDARCTAAKTG
jgi:hypothetical protein